MILPFTNTTALRGSGRGVLHKAVRSIEGLPDCIYLQMQPLDATKASLHGTVQQALRAFHLIRSADGEDGREKLLKSMNTGL